MFLRKKSPKNILSDQSEITVIITVWKRNHLLEQLEALESQTTRACAIWVYQCENHIKVKDILAKYNDIKLIHSDVNFKYFGRFSLAQYIKSKYVWIVDDDVIPSNEWLEECTKLCEKEAAIISSAGRIIPKGDFYPENKQNIREYYIGDNDPYALTNYCCEMTEVDFGCNSWFLKSDWIKKVWSINPFTLETGEDIHLSSTLKISLGLKTIVPKQTTKLICGNLNKAYGNDEIASWKAPSFQKIRSDIIKYLVEEYSWKPLKW